MSPATAADRILVPIVTSSDILNFGMFEGSDDGGDEIKPFTKRHLEKDRRAVTDELNNWRRTFPASNMHYTVSTISLCKYRA
jgi:hypothetical protein